MKGKKLNNCIEIKNMSKRTHPLGRYSITILKETRDPILLTRAVRIEPEKLTRPDLGSEIIPVVDS